MGRAIQKRSVYPAIETEVHLDMGGRITGREVPFWDECRSLAVRAHEFSEVTVPVVGWDIAVLEGGPTLIEGNTVPCAVLSQMPSGDPLGTTDYPAAVLACLESEFVQYSTI